METKLFDVPITVSNSMLSSKCDCKRIRRINEVTLMDFTSVIMVEILSRLPMESIFRCKSVCKRWYNLFADPLFLKMYHTRSPNFPCILLSLDYVLLLLELRADNYEYNYCIMLNRKFHLPRPRDLLSVDDDDMFGFSFIERNLTLVGSCNGFICLLNGATHDEYHSVCISNPLLGEYFKVSCCPVGESIEVSELEIYTLGVDDNKWRNVGKAPIPLWGKLSNVNVNGSLHWMDDENKSASIYSFNTGTEEVKSLPTPPGLEAPSVWMTLAELGNCLCLSVNSSFQHMDIWWMKEDGIAESWTKDRILKEFIPLDIRHDRFIPIIIWNDAEILMQSERGTQLVSYNPKEKKFRKVNLCGSGTAATRYIPSLYSLQTVMGDNFEVSNVYRKTRRV
ncbi:F-box protein At3g07870-like [Lycium ferocissimum]|uniref:F-box protein At3g07870-like n=1 Tax=Lycium ferocissimum TaxID=112874 RepID=UPI002814DA44|nr:F-box protein At3g07870-like [Lycium ferocissimum]